MDLGVVRLFNLIEKCNEESAESSVDGTVREGEDETESTEDELNRV